MEKITEKATRAKSFRSQKSMGQQDLGLIEKVDGLQNIVEHDSKTNEKIENI